MCPKSRLTDRCSRVAPLFLLPRTSLGEDISDLRQRAEKGDAVAQCHLGVAYENGNGVPKDYPRSRGAVPQGCRTGQRTSSKQSGRSYTNSAEELPGITLKR